MTPSRFLLRWLWALTLLLVSLPGNGSELAVCIGQDGHLDLATAAAHCASDRPAVAKHCDEDVVGDNGACLDLLLCGQDDNLLRNRAPSLPTFVPPSTTLALTPPTRSHPLRVTQPPVPPGGWLHHHRTVVLRL